jgi:hypothetical protein
MQVYGASHDSLAHALPTRPQEQAQQQAHGPVMIGPNAAETVMFAQHRGSVAVSGHRFRGWKSSLQRCAAAT